MKKIYEKRELTFAIVWIVIYCILQSFANPLNEMIGVEYSASAVFCALQALIIWNFIRKNNLSKRYGLCKSGIPARRFLYYVPLFILSTRNFWNNITVNYSWAGTVCRIVCMLCVGFVEEVIFRGFLFKGIEEDRAETMRFHDHDLSAGRNGQTGADVKTAVIISSVTFGLGHLLNLVNGSGAGLAENLFQVTGAIAIGFLFVILFYRGGSLLPCIITHSAINITSTFADETGLTLGKRLLFQLVLFVITVSYALFLTKSLPEKSDG